MDKKYIIGVDEGSQSAKILIFDLEGNIICEGKEPLRPYDLPRPGIVEHPDDDWWTAICKAAKKCMANFKGDTKDILAIGLCTIRFCRAYLKEDGSLYSPGMSWMDIRVSKPYNNESDEIKYITTSSGYIAHKFTGEFKDTAANYQGMWPIDTDTWEWSKEGSAYEAVGIPKDMLFELVMPGEILGYVTEEAANATSFPKGLPVVATSNDKAVEGLGVGLSGKKIACVSLGTYIATMMEGTTNPKGTTNFWTNFASKPNAYLYESNGIRRGMWTISWFKDILGDSYSVLANEKGMSAEELLSIEASEISAGSDGLMTILDWLAPTDALYKKGMMIGFDGRHKRAHIYRSILEAIALTMKLRTDEMCEELGTSLDEIIITGGGSNSDLFMQIFADVFGIPSVRNEVNGAAGVGSAICAAVAMGAYSNFEEAQEKMVRIRDRFMPNKDANEIYQKMLPIYADVTSHTDAILKKTYEIFN